MFERFTSDARDAVVFGVEEANAVGADRVGAEHLLLGAVREPDIDRRPRPGRLGVDHCACGPRCALCRPTGSTPTRSPASASTSTPCGRRSRPSSARARSTTPRPSSHPAPAAAGRSTPRPGRCIEIALREAVRLKHRRIDTGHLLLGVVRVDDPRAARTLDGLGLADEAVRRAVYGAWAQDPAGLP